MELFDLTYDDIINALLAYYSYVRHRQNEQWDIETFVLHEFEQRFGDDRSSRWREDMRIRILHIQLGWLLHQRGYVVKTIIEDDDESNIDLPSELCIHQRTETHEIDQQPVRVRVRLYVPIHVAKKTHTLQSHIESDFDIL